jgi:hypothetical protein
MSPARMAFDHRPVVTSATSGTDTFVLGMAFSVVTLISDTLCYSFIIQTLASPPR